MKRTLALVLLLAALCLPSASAAEGRTVSVRLNGALLTQNALLRDGVTYLPLRALMEALGFTVTWESESRSALAVSESCYLAAPVGSRAIHINHRTLYAAEETVVRDGVTYAPLRLIAEELGLSVHWDRAAQCAVVGGSVTNTPYCAEDLYWLSRIISAESRGETLTGQIAVGNVVLNRVQSDAFASDIRAVIFEVLGGYTQFEPVINGTIYDEPSARSVTAAKLALAGVRTAGESLYFFSPALSSGSWIRASRSYYTTIGCHEFYL